MMVMNDGYNEDVGDNDDDDDDGEDNDVDDNDVDEDGGPLDPSILILANPCAAIPPLFCPWEAANHPDCSIASHPHHQ